MKTTAVTKADLERSVLAVPPLARKADFALDREQNGKLVRYLEAGGVSTLIYGGNANFYNLGVSDYGATMDALAELAGPETWVVPSVGPDFGKALDQAAVLRDGKFPTAMVLPLAFPATSRGAAIGIRKIAERLGRPVIAYLKAESNMEPGDMGALAKEGALCGIKYAVVRKDPAQDDFLRRILDAVGHDLVISGIGERPAIEHLRGFKLTGFTSGSVCVAPRLSTALLAALKAKDYVKASELREPFMALEDFRDTFSPIRVLHAAVTLAGIADMGPMLPMLSEIADPAHLDAIAGVARVLRSKDEAFGTRRAA